MRKITAASLLLSLLFTTTISLQAQTRPRRVTQVTNRENLERRESEPRRSGRRWPWLLGTGIAIGIGSIAAGTGSCTPSRDVIRSRPRFTLDTAMPR